MAERYPLPVGFGGPDWTAIAQRADYAQTECFRSIGREAARAKRLFLRRRLRGKRAPARVSFRYAAVTRKTDSSYGRQENEEAAKHSLRGKTTWLLANSHSMLATALQITRRWIRLSEHVATPTPLADWSRSCVTPRPS